MTGNAIARGAETSAGAAYTERRGIRFSGRTRRAGENDGRFLRVSDVAAGGSGVLLGACEACFAEWNPPKPLMESSSEVAAGEERIEALRQEDTKGGNEGAGN